MVQASPHTTSCLTALGDDHRRLSAVFTLSLYRSRASFLLFNYQLAEVSLDSSSRDELREHLRASGPGKT